MAKKQKINKRRLSLKKLGISDKRYKELCGFCEQYPEWKEKLDDLESNLHGMEYTGMPAYHTNSNSTMNLAVRRAELSDKCELIEHTAETAGADLAFYLIKNICYMEPYNRLTAFYGMACSAATFYDARRYFFWLLDQRKK